MLTSAIVRLINFCVRHARIVVALFVLAGVLAGGYAARHFKITSDINALLSADLPWRQRETAFENNFHRFQMLVAVVEAPTPELTQAATAELTRRLSGDKTHFLEATNIAGLPFFARNGLLFLPLEFLRGTLDGLKEGAPLIQDMASDMSLRGLVAGLEDGLLGLNAGRLKLDAMTPLLNGASEPIEAVLAGKPASFSWRVLTQGHPAAPGDLRGVIEVRPVMDFKSVQPGLESSDALRAIAAQVLPAYQARVRLTGPVAMADEEFGTIKENATRNGIITGAIVLLILWLALRSWKLIGAVTLNLMVGLALTAALGLAMVGAFNLISVYFAVLFVGIGVDFGIQYCVRYRAERHDNDNLVKAISGAGVAFGAPLTLAGLATAAGFLSFLPTEYKGVSELGLIAGFGMLIAFATSVTMLPALIYCSIRPASRSRSASPRWRRWTATWRAIASASSPARPIVVIAGLPLFHWLKFDFNPINLRDPHTEAVATYLELARDPAAEVNAIQALAPSLAEATAARKNWSRCRKFRMYGRCPSSSRSSRTKSCPSSPRRWRPLGRL